MTRSTSTQLGGCEIHQRPKGERAAPYGVLLTGEMLGAWDIWCLVPIVWTGEVAATILARVRVPMPRVWVQLSTWRGPIEPLWRTRFVQIPELRLVAVSVVLPFCSPRMEYYLPCT